MFTLSKTRHTRSKPAKRSRLERRARLETLERRNLLTALVWSSGPELQEPRTDSVALLAPHDAVYLVGGDAVSATATPVLEANATNWTYGQKIDTQRNDLGATRSGGAIYLFGGTGNTEGSDEVLSYDDRFGDSQDLAKMIQIRYDFGYASDGAGRAYAIGGIGVRDDDEIWSQSERYDPATGAWTAIAPLPQALHGTSAIGDGSGHIFVFGGSAALSDASIQATGYSYEIATDSWSTIAPMPVATRDSAIVMDEAGAIYVIGGMSSTGATDAVQVYDSSINAWTSQTSLPTPVYSHAAAYDSLGRIIVAGGFDSTHTATSAVFRTQRLNVAQTAPSFTSAPVMNGSLDKPYTYDVDASGNPAPSYSLVTSPTGMTIDAGTGVTSWQPMDGQLGIHPVTIRASNTVADIDQSFDVTVVADTIAPTAPSNFVVDSTTETSATLSWTASVDAVGVDRYEVSTARYTGPRFGKHWVYTLVDTITTTTSTMAGLTPLSTTTFSVQAIDAAGNRSPRSPRITATTLAVPTLSFSAGSQTSGTVQSPAKHPLEIQLISRANPEPTFSIVNGPTTMTVNPTTGIVHWTPTVAEMGVHTITFRAENSVGGVDLDVVVDVISDAPQLSVVYNPTTGGHRYALAGTLFNTQISDASQSPSAYELVSAPTGMAIDATTGLVSWTPNGNQGGTHRVTVRGTNAGGTTDLSFDVLTHFTGPVSNVAVTGTTLLNPTVNWVAPTGDGANLVDSYTVNAYVRYRYGRAWRTHSVNFVAQAGSETAELTGLLTGKNYTLTITPLDAAGNAGLANRDATVTYVPALPQVGWTVNGFTGGLSVPGPVVAGQPAEIILTDRRPDPSTIRLISGPAELTFDPTNNTANWTPGASDVTSGYGTTDVTFEATNSVGSVNVVVPIRVFFSGTVRNASATKNGTAVSVRWDPPTDNATSVVGYQITAHWTWSGRPRSSTRTVGNVTSASYAQYPTGAVNHRGVTITPIDAGGNLGVTSDLILYGAPPNGSAPVAMGDLYDTTEETAITVTALAGVLANDTDTDGNSLTARLVAQPAGGVVTLATNGSFTYTPNEDFNGADSFTYVASDGSFSSTVATATINVAAVNDAPTALFDYYSTDNATSLNVGAAMGVLANDADVDGDALASILVDQPTGGTVTMNTDGSFDYLPNVGFGGVDTFRYQASDGLLDSNIATVSVTVSSPPVAVADSYSTDEDVPLAAANVLTNDLDPLGTGLTATLVSGASNGTVTLSEDGSFSYAPSTNFNGTDTFTYRANAAAIGSVAATVTITVNSVNDAPVAINDSFTAFHDSLLTIDTTAGLLANDADVDGDSLIAVLADAPLGGTVTVNANGAFVYTPNKDFSGPDSFGYRASDGSDLSNLATVTVNVDPPPTTGTRFFVVDFEASSTFEYDVSGDVVENYVVNKKPQGSAASKDGSTVWVVDKEGYVHVYDGDGASRGLWRPIGPIKYDGIATDESSIWIVDRENDQVFYYADSASRLSGSLSATSSFQLDSQNKKAMGITSDGTHLWVVDNAEAIDRVYKYTVDGTYVGRWQIDAANSTPTGITIDPNDVSNIWIVDAGTDKVYQYDNAASRLSDQQNANSSWALAAGNTDPQGIADPAAHMEQSLGVPLESVSPLLQDQHNPLDTNSDGKISALDALRVINHLSRNQNESVNALTDEDRILDVNNDGLASALDALLVINALDRENGESSLADSEQALDLAITQLTDALAIINVLTQQTEQAEAESVNAASVDASIAGLFYDVNDDGRASASDALRVINQLEGESESTGADELHEDESGASEDDGATDGNSDALSDAQSDATTDGGIDGASDGDSDAASDANTDGGSDGSIVSSSDDASSPSLTDAGTDGGIDGASDGDSDAASDGGIDGASDGNSDAASDAGSDGNSDGDSDGNSDADSDGGSD